MRFTDVGREWWPVVFSDKLKFYLLGEEKRDLTHSVPPPSALAWPALARAGLVVNYYSISGPIKSTYEASSRRPPNVIRS
jgi:hypothetical protein